MNKTKGTLAAELAGRRRRAERAQHAVRRRIVAAAVAVTVTAAGAGMLFAITQGDASGSGSQDRNSATAAPTAAPTTEANATEPHLNERGNIAKELGEIAGFGSAEEPDQNTFAVEHILVDPPCAQGRTRPESEHTVLLYVTAHTGADAKRAGMLGRILTPGFFEAIAPDGSRHDAWPGECTDPADQLPDDFIANRDYSGAIELRLPLRTGTLVLSGVMSNAAGWEWRF